MSRELLLIADSVANEKAVPRHLIFEALEQALAGAKRKQLGVDALVRVAINQNDGSYEAFRRWEVIADDAVMDEPERQLRLMDALDEADGGVDVGDFIEEPVDPPRLGRVAAQTAKQIIHQRVRDGERAIIRDEWSTRVGEMVLGSVKRYEKNQAYIDLGNGAEGVISRANLIPGERLRVGDRVRSILVQVDAQARGPQLILSRTSPLLVKELFALEVPEVAQGVLEIVACARDPGSRAKVAVRALDKRVDPIGACIGMRGSRIQAVTNELNGERVDVVLWNEDPASFAIAAMAPAEIEKIILDEPGRKMEMGVSDKKLALAIGRGGQNVRLASQLTGWNLYVMSSDQLEAKSEAERSMAVARFVSDLEVDEEIAGLLVDSGFLSLEDVAYVSVGELLVIDEFDEEIVDALQERARDALLVQELRVEEGEEAASGLQLSSLAEVAAIPGLAHSLVEAGVKDTEELAELSTDELLDLHLAGVTVENAGAIILAARAPWFK